jgi:EAL domain-containing protein (putative c-di-GMP-specific phosphodiesterase class I)
MRRCARKADSAKLSDTIRFERCSIMVDSSAHSEGGAGRARHDLNHVLVPPAMLVTAIAMAVASHLHLGFAPELATAIGIALFCLMLTSHVLLRAADEAERVEDEAAERDMAHVTSPLPAVAPTEAEIEARLARTAAVEERPPEDKETAPREAASPAPSFAPQAPAFDRNGERDVAPAWAFRPVDLRQPAADAIEFMPAAAGTEARETPELPGLGELRPTIEAHRLQSSAAPSGAQLSIDREADRIDSILKRLARQIHAGTAARRERGAPVLGEPSLMLPGTLEPETAETPPLEELAARSPDTALASAVDALRSTVEAMRGPAAAPLAAEHAPVPTPAEVSVAAVAEAIQAEAADVFLSPILGLADHSARHFEVSVHLRSEVAEVRTVAEGAGLLPLLDALAVRHAAGFALMLERRGREGAVFSRIGSRSLESDGFVTDVAGRHAEGIADRMVLAFAQNEMRGLGPAQITALEDLARLGFRFSLQGIADLDMDFEALQALGFEFVKLDAQVFQAGLPCGGETVPAAEICQHFADLGLSVIVCDIADEATRERMVGWGVAYGQGELFGAPRPVPVAQTAGTMAA